MHFLAENLKSIRKFHNLTQQDFAKQLGVKRSLIGAYEEGRAEPRISFLQLVAERFEVSLDQLVSQPLEKGEGHKRYAEGQHLRILPIAIDKDTNDERSTLVPVKAAAGYLGGYGDVEFIESLPSFSLPFPELPSGRTYRIFQIEGDSMLPVPSGAYIICSYVQDWNDVKNDHCYVVLSKDDGIAFKRVLNNMTDGSFTMKSDNPEFKPYELPVDQIIEVWKSHGIVSFEDLMNASTESDLASEVRDLKQQMQLLIEAVKPS